MYSTKIMTFYTPPYLHMIWVFRSMIYADHSSTAAAAACTRPPPSHRGTPGFYTGTGHHIDLLRFSERTNSALDDIGRKDNLAAEPATAERAVLDRMVDLLTIDPAMRFRPSPGREPAGEFEHVRLRRQGCSSLASRFGASRRSISLATTPLRTQLLVSATMERRNFLHCSA
jgi:hypothetical protein